MNSVLETTIVAGVLSIAGGVIAALVTLRANEAQREADIAVAHIGRDTQEDMSRRDALVKEQARLDAERARLDAAREALEKGRSVEIGNLKLRVNGLEETLVAERAEHAKQLAAMNERIINLERQLLQAHIEIAQLQREQHGGHDD